MNRLLLAVITVCFIALGIAILAGWIARDLPEESGLRTMLGVVAILFGLYRGAIYFLGSPRRRRPYGGFRRRINLDERGGEKPGPRDETNDS